MMRRLLIAVCATVAFVPVAYLAWLSRARWSLVSGELMASLATSLTLATSVALLGTALGLVTSRAVATSPRRGAWLGMAYLPFLVSPVVLGTLLSYVFLVLGLGGTFAGVLIAQLIVVHGLAVVLLVGVWTPRLAALEGVARTLGASPWQAWSRVLVPATFPAVRWCYFQTFVVAWMQYGLTLLIGGGRIKTLPLMVFAYVSEADPSYGAAAALMLIIPPIVFWRLEAYATR